MRRGGPSIIPLPLQFSLSYYETKLPSAKQQQKQDAKLSSNSRMMTTMMSKDMATPNPSFRVYYGGAPGSVPFTWESAPGTPKHRLFSSSSAAADDDHSNLPPLTPPPSFYSSSNHSRRRRRFRSSSAAAIRLPNFLFRALFPKPSAAAASRSSATSSSYSSHHYSDHNYNSNCSLSYSSSSTSSSSSSSSDAHGRKAWGQSRCFSCSGLHRRRHASVDEEESKGGSAVMKKRRSVSLGRWCSFGRVRNAV